MIKNSVKIPVSFLILTALCFSCASSASTVKTMDGDSLVARNSGREKDKILIIDVRPEAEYRAGHIENAINMLSDTIADNLAAIEPWKNMPIIVYCNTGKRSAAAAEVLTKNGFKEVYNAAGVKQYEYNLVTYTDILPADLLKMQQDPNTILVDYRPQDILKMQSIFRGAKYKIILINFQKKKILFCIATPVQKVWKEQKNFLLWAMSMSLMRSSV